MTICLTVPSGNLKTHQDFVSRRINHPSPNEQAPADDSQDVLLRQLSYGLGTPKGILDQDSRTLVEGEISRGIAQTGLREVPFPES